MTENSDEEALPCIICGREFENIPFAATNQPLYGTTFTTYGHYGSGVFDLPGDGSYLEINICDECLKDRKGYVIHGKERKVEPIIVYRNPWEPEE